MKNRICAFVVLSLASYCQANDSFVIASGGTVAPMKANPHIRMVQEDIWVQLPECAVVSRFVFKNEGPATKIQIGFPEEGYNNGEEELQKRSRFKYFRSYVNGKRISVSRKTENLEEENTVRYWWVKTVSFRRGEAKVIVNKYQTTPGGMVDDKTYRLMTYIVNTGAPWKGKIGTATITFKLGSIAKRFSKKQTTPGFRREGNSLVWRRRNFEPDEDSDISVFWVGRLDKP